MRCDLLPGSRRRPEAHTVYPPAESAIGLRRVGADDDREIIRFDQFRQRRRGIQDTIQVKEFLAAIEDRGHMVPTVQLQRRVTDQLVKLESALGPERKLAGLLVTRQTPGVPF